MRWGKVGVRRGEGGEGIKKGDWKGEVKGIVKEVGWGLWKGKGG